MTDSLLDENWLTQLASYRKLWVGLSGGLDSTVLLHSLAQHPALASKLSAIHIHHGLSPYADAWIEHCQTVCASLSIPITVRFVAFEQDFNIEEHARKARYEAFLALLNENDGLLLAHHVDDQAETLLLQLLRGAGIDGLASMPAIKTLGSGQVLRPFLNCSRVSLEAYADLHQLKWIDDESNQDSAFSRNYLRHQVMPLLRHRWPSAINNLARTASHCQAAKANLHALAELDCPELIDCGNILSLKSLLIKNTLDQARLANILRIWLNNNQVRLPSTSTFNRIIDEVIYARRDAAPSVEWDGVRVRRYQNKLYLGRVDHSSSESLRPATCSRDRETNCQQPLLKQEIIGSVDINSFFEGLRPATCSRDLEILLNAQHDCTEINRFGSREQVAGRREEIIVSDLSIDWPQFPASLSINNKKLCVTCSSHGLHVPPGSRVQVRFRQGGEVFFWHGQTKALKKLLQVWHVPPWLRDTIPLVYVDDELVAVVGFAINDRFYKVDQAYIYQIELH